jgi:RecA/RadA recombinase
MPFSSMARSEKIIDLRNLMAMRFPQAPMPVVGKYLVTGLDSFDQSIGGGLPKGAITELITLLSMAHIAINIL